MEMHFSAVGLFTIYITLVSFATCDDRFYVEENIRRTGDYYWVNSTEITIVCQPHDDAEDFCISEVDSSGQRTPNLAVENNGDDKYTYKMQDGGKHSLSVRKPVQLSQFLCKWKNPWFCGLFICWFESKEEHFVKILVLETTPQHVRFCTLLNDHLVGNRAVLFVGNNITFICSEGGLKVTLIVGNSTLELPQPIKEEKIGEDMYIHTINNIGSSLNRSRISCTETDKGGGDMKDYCGKFPVIIVYEAIDVYITLSSRWVPNGGNLTLLCRSDLYHLASEIELYVLGNVTFTNETREDINGEEQLSLSNVTISSSVLVVCEVSIGSESGNASVRIHEGVHLETTSTETTLDATNEAGLPNEHSSEPLIIAIVIPVVLLGLATASVLVAVLLRRRSAAKSRTATEGGSTGNRFAVSASAGDNGHQTSDVYYYVDSSKKVDLGEREGIPSTMTGNRDEDSTVYHYVDANDRAKLGLDQGDSEVADNIAYVSYDD